MLQKRKSYPIYQLYVGIDIIIHGNKHRTKSEKKYENTIIF